MMENKFSDLMSGKTDAELIAIATVSRNDYDPLAAAAAEQELKARNISPETIKNAEAEPAAQSYGTDDFEESKANRTLRFIHSIVDTIAVYLLAFVFSMILQSFWSPVNDLQVKFIAIIIIALAVFAYFVPLEYKFQKSLGKFLTKTKVVTTEGKTPSLEDIIRRTACRFVPFDRISFLFTKNGFHDYLSATTVVRDEETADIIFDKGTDHTESGL